jgi:hypothetical protein
MVVETPHNSYIKYYVQTTYLIQLSLYHNYYVKCVLHQFCNLSVYRASAQHLRLIPNTLSHQGKIMSLQFLY